jgi:subtilisin family serine protease
LRTDFVEALRATGGLLRSRWSPPIIAKEKNMDRRTSAVALLAAVSLAACSPDTVNAPIRSSGLNAASFAQQFGNGGKARHIFLAKGTAVPADLETRVAALGGTVERSHSLAGYAVVSGLSVAAASSLAAIGIGEVLPDGQIALDKPTRVMRTVADAASLGDVSINSQANPATAQLRTWQWNLSLVNAPAAWSAGKLGSPSVTVAILDTGIDYNYYDSNLLVDLSRSKSFMDTFVGRDDDPATPENDSDPIVPSDDALVAGLFPGRHAITDLNGHGTNVASQVSSNSLVFAGVTSKTTLIGVKVLGANGVGNLSDILSGVLWAADHGADVANMSLGGGFSKAGNGELIRAINKVFNYAYKKGMVIVVSAGNSSTDLQRNGNAYSSYCDAPHVICVSAVGPTTATGDGDKPASYTSFGSGSVDVAAPGGNAGATLSAWPWGADNASWVFSLCPRQLLAIGRSTVDPTRGVLLGLPCNAPPGFFSINGYLGTSQAAPHVAGLAALLIADGARRNPNKIKTQIQKTGVRIDRDYGRSRMDVKAALKL